MSEVIITMPLSLVDKEIFDAKGHLLAKCWRQDIAEFLINKANSQPDLLEACKAIIENRAKPGNTQITQNEWDKLKTAIAKAEKE